MAGKSQQTDKPELPRKTEVFKGPRILGAPETLAPHHPAPQRAVQALERLLSPKRDKVTVRDSVS